jgi:uncharacterized protein YndB with AHSA1/START domain
VPADDFGDESQVEISAPPEQVWALISDPTRTPEWSPVCRRVEWIPPSSQPAVGARFRGHNQLRAFKWARECEIDEWEPARTIAFHTEFKGHVSTRWHYTLEPSDGGTRLRETYRAAFLPTWVWLLRKLPGGASTSAKDTKKNISTSLEKIKQLAEAAG